MFQFFKKLFVAIWVGKIVFFAFGVATTVFKVLNRQDAAMLQAAIFPKYFGLGLVCTLLIFLMSLTSYFLSQKSRKHLLIVCCSGTAVVIYMFLMFQLTPELLELQKEALLIPKDSLDPVAVEFRNLHKLSTSLNLVVLVLGLLCLFFI